MASPDSTELVTATSRRAVDCIGPSNATEAACTRMSHTCHTDTTRGAPPSGHDEALQYRSDGGNQQQHRVDPNDLEPCDRL